MEQMQAIIQACVETSSPVILQVSSGARKYANQTILRYMAQGAVEYAKELGKNIPIVLHLDHGDTFELCKSCIDMGFSSVMIDGSSLPYDENVAPLTRRVVEYAHQHDVTVEGELGVLAVAWRTKCRPKCRTTPVPRTWRTREEDRRGLAGHLHRQRRTAPTNSKPEQCTRNAEGVLVPPPLRFDILEEIEKRIPGFPSCCTARRCPREYVRTINAHGGALKDAVGIPRGPAPQGRQKRRAARSTSTRTAVWR